VNRKYQKLRTWKQSNLGRKQIRLGKNWRSGRFCPTEQNYKTFTYIANGSRQFKATAFGSEDSPSPYKHS